MTAGSTDLSSGLEAISEALALHQDSEEGINIDQVGVRKLVRILKILQSLAVSFEIEVRCLRDMEAGRGAREFLDQDALKFLSEMLPDQEGNVIKPEFGRRS